MFPNISIYRQQERAYRKCRSQRIFPNLLAVILQWSCVVSLGVVLMMQTVDFLI